MHAGRSEQRVQTLGHTILKNMQKSTILRVIREWLCLQAYVELFDWPPRGPDMNPTENTWNGFKWKSSPSSLPEIMTPFGPLDPYIRSM